MWFKQLADHTHSLGWLVSYPYDWLKQCFDRNPALHVIVYTTPSRTVRGVYTLQQIPVCAICADWYINEMEIKHIFRVPTELYKRSWNMRRRKGDLGIPLEILVFWVCISQRLFLVLSFFHSFLFSIITQLLSKITHGDWPENPVINLNNHLQVIITVKAQKQDGGYLCRC